MSQAQGAGILRQIRALATAQGSSLSTDLQLLQQFIAERDEAAFAVLVQRHGATVLGVCRGVLHHQQDAEDVFQAAFLVLARKAHTIRKQQSLGSWLHGVAYRLALKARTQAGRRRQRESAAPASGSHQELDDISVRELRIIVHEELHRLPEKYRAPLLLCYWEGKTRDEAAEQTGVTADAFKKYLERARNLLKSRLVGRGLAPSAAFMAVLFSENGVKAAVSSVLTQSTARAAVAFAAGKGASAGASAAAVMLAEGAIQTMTITKWATMILMLIFTGALGTGLSVSAYHALQGQQLDAAVGPGAINGAQPVVFQGKEPAGKKTDKERIVGTWRFTSGRGNGEEIPEEFKMLARLKFTKDSQTIMTMLEEAKEGKYNLVGAGKIDLTFNIDETVTSLGIYKFDGDDRLTICAKEGAGNRPTEFAAEKADGHVLFVLQRAKPGEEKVTPEELAKAKGGVNKLQEAAARTVSANNLKQIAIAFHNYHDTFGALPTHAIYSKDGKTPLLSWRVAILPYIEHQDLYKEFKLDEPWNSEHNKKLIAKMPKLYEAPVAAKKKDGETYYQVFTGPDTVFNGAKKMKFTDIADGTSNTLLAAEAKDSVIWTKPDDLTVPKDKDKLPAVGGFFSNGFNVLFCDGSVRFVSLKVSPELFRSIITPAGGEGVDRDKLDEK